MDTVTLAVFLSWLCGGFVAGVTSMGAALFAVPITAFFLPMQDAVLLSCLSLPFMMIAIVGLNVRACRLKSILPLPACGFSRRSPTGRSEYAWALSLFSFLSGMRQPA